MKQQYETIEAEIIRFTGEDVITESNETTELP